MNYRPLQDETYLANLATCSISLRHRYCPNCQMLQFKGEAVEIEIRCRRCKSLLTFSGESVSVYRIRPY